MGSDPLQGTQQSAIPVSITDVTAPLKCWHAARALASRPPPVQDNPFSTYFTQIIKTWVARQNEPSEHSISAYRNMPQPNSVEKSVQIAVSRRPPRQRRLTKPKSVEPAIDMAA